jgi:hypothetical protein
MKLTAQAMLMMVLATSPVVAVADQAQPAQQPQQPVSVAGLRKAMGPPETVKATITTIDPTEQIVVLKGDSGAERTLYLGQDIAKITHLKVGDRIALTYHMSLATQVLRPGETAQPGRVGAEIGTAGGRTIAEQLRWVVEVNSVDQQKGTVTVTTEKGRTITFLAEDKSRIAQLKPGDRIEVLLTAAAVVSVEPGPAR